MTETMSARECRILDLLGLLAKIYCADNELSISCCFWQYALVAFTITHYALCFVLN